MCYEGERMTWMKTGSPQGDIVCPTCTQKIGTYNWKVEEGEKTIPMFRVEKDKVVLQQVSLERFLPKRMPMVNSSSMPEVKSSSHLLQQEVALEKLHISASIKLQELTDE
jgi:hypothetical protein